MNELRARVRRWRGSPPKSGALGVSAAAAGVDALAEGDAIAVAPTTDYEDPAALAAMLPAPVPGALIVVFESGDASVFARILGRRVRVSRAVRGAALLLAGYRTIGGGVDTASGQDLCWAEG